MRSRVRLDSSPRPAETPAGESRVVLTALVTAGAQVVAGALCLPLGLILVGLVSLVYQGVVDASVPRKKSIYTVRQIMPDVELHTSPWRESQHLPRRLHIRWCCQREYCNTYRATEVQLWHPRAMTGEEFVRAKVRMLDFRAGQVLTAPDAATPFWVAFLGACLLSVSNFLLLAGATRLWLLLPSVRHRMSRAHLLLATAFSTAVLCTLPRLLFVTWAPGYPAPGMRPLSRFQWEAWSWVQVFLHGARHPAVWSLFTALLCWLGILAMAGALSFAARRFQSCDALAGRFYRLLGWSMPVLVAVYFVFSILLGRPVIPSMLVVSPP